MKWFQFNLTFSVNFDGQFEDGLSVSDSLCTAAAPSPQKKSQKGCLWGRGTTVHGLVSFLALVWKRPTTKCLCPVFLMIAKDRTEGLSAVALSVGLIIPRGKCVSGHVSERVFFFSDTPPKYPDRDYVGRRCTGTRHGNVYRSVREKQEIVVYRQRV